MITTLHSIRYWLLGLLVIGLRGAVAQVSLTSGALTYSQNFNTLPATASAPFAQNSTVAGLYAERTGTGTTIVANNGSSNAGNLYSYGATEDRALGSVGSGNAAAGDFTYGLRVKNQTGAAITSLTVAYVGEQWRNAGAAAQTITFAYRVATTEITSTEPGGGEVPTGYTAVPDLAFTSPVTGGTAAALDGNLAANRQAKTFTITGLSVANGSEIMLRWFDPDHSGSDHGLSIDDLSVSVNAPVTGAPAIAIQTNGFRSFTTTSGTPSAPQSYVISGTNFGPSDDLTVTPPTGFEVDLGNGYKASETLPGTRFGAAGTVTVNVRLKGDAVGPYSGSILHRFRGNTIGFPVSGTVTQGTGTGIGTIAEARSKPDNTPLSAVTGGRIAGRVTASNQFGTTAFIQDATGGIAIFSQSFANGVQIGDSVQITGGTIGSFNQLKQVGGTVTFTNVGPKGAPVPKKVSVAQLANYEGQLVAIDNAQVRPLTTVSAPNPVFVFTPDANYDLSDGSGSAQIRSVRFTNLPGNTNPSGPASITGIVGRFRTDLQLQPRFTQDVPSTAPYVLGGGNIDRGRTLDVAAWNIEWLGNTGNGPTNENLQFQNAISVLSGLQSDVIVLQEISSADAITRLLAGLPGYQGNCSPFVSNNPGHELPPNPATPTTVPDDAQRVCILYKPDVLSLVSQRPLLEKAQPLANYPTEPENFWASGRYPYMWTFNTTVNGTQKRLNIVGLHAKANTTQPDSYLRRKYDAQVLYDSLNAQFPNDWLIVAGDFNDDTDFTVATEASIPSTESTYKQFVDDQARYTFVTRSLSDNGFRTYLTSDNVIDQILVSNELTPAYVAGSAGVGIPFTTIADYGNTTSDHLPVVARFDLSLVGTTPEPGTGLAILEPTYDCATGGLLVQTTGGNNAPKEYRIIGLRDWSADPLFFVPSWQRTGTPFNVEVRQNGQVFNRMFTTVCQQTPPPTGALAISGIDYQCPSGRLDVKATGGNGSLIEYRIVGLRDWSSNSTFSVPAWQQNGTTFNVEVRQSGQVINQYFTTLCQANARLGSDASSTAWVATVLENPVKDAIQIQLTALVGITVDIQLTDLYGRPVHRLQAKGVGQTEQILLPVQSQGAGLYLLHLSAADKKQVVKILKQ
ncbi:DUF5689 domain-containing protein [Tellurirhabdus bombi]|uniref:DUF5689 domain-containing protein n=1 Tax=Tellurirhabdus bombi TaxID=2907205 RepID=UPI001F293D9F|nr:DUF5689 domain-containing protein [Tellurirhabdus bombi]